MRCSRQAIMSQGTPVLCGNPSALHLLSSSRPIIIVDDPAQSIPPLPCSNVATPLEGYRAALLQAVVRSGLVEIINLFDQHATPMRLIHAEELVQRRFAPGSDPTFGQGIRGGCPVGGAHDRTVFGGEAAVEARRKFRSPIRDQEAPRSRLIGQRPGPLTSWLGYPFCRRMFGAARTMHPPTAAFDQEQRLPGLEPGGFYREESAGQNLLTIMT